MKLPEVQTYVFKNKSRRCYEVRLKSKKTKGFVKPATKKGPKIYCFVRSKKIWYVGITSQAMSSRINYGLKAKGKGGYHGYKFKNKKVPLRLYVWCFPESIRNGQNFVKAIEAEVVYLVRERSNKWPLYQTEIHFQQSTKTQQHFALRIVETIT